MRVVRRESHRRVSSGVRSYSRFAILLCDSAIDTLHDLCKLTDFDMICVVEPRTPLSIEDDVE